MSCSPVVLGMILRLETRGWHGPAPRLAFDPIKVEAGRSRVEQSFFYDLLPAAEAMSVETACARAGSRLEKLLCSAEALGGETFFAARCRLEVGLWVEADRTSYSYSWPAEFLQILAAADVELAVSHYVAGADEDEDSLG
jgi:hypothetical protein